MNFSKNAGSPREIAERRFKNAKSTLLLVSVLTFVNILLLIFESDSMFLFYAFVPYAVAVVGYFIEAETIAFLCYGIAFILAGVYALLALLSKKHFAAMVAALIYFCVDTVLLISFLLYDSAFASDMFFHIIILVSLISGVIAGNKLKKLPPEEPIFPAEEINPADYYAENDDTKALRIADTDVKERIFAEFDAAGHHICYRRVGRTNELVIDGYVYDEYEKLVETQHELNARLGGYDFAAGYDASSKSYISVNGTRVVEKFRLW